jgi:hypothetical protein
MFNTSSSLRFHCIRAEQEDLVAIGQFLPVPLDREETVLQDSALPAQKMVP